MASVRSIIIVGPRFQARNTSVMLDAAVRAEEFAHE